MGEIEGAFSEAVEKLNSEKIEEQQAVKIVKKAIVGQTLSLKNGYVLIFLPDHPYSKSQRGWLHEHRVVMENHLKRRLIDSEIVHHINGERSDNRIENLQLTNKESHPKIHKKENEENPETGGRIKEMILESISRLREEELSYSEIGKLLEMNSGQVQMLEKGTWYPKTRKVENRIFIKLTRQPINFKREVENGI